MFNKCRKCNYINFGKTNRYIFLILIEALLSCASDIIEKKSKFFTQKNLVTFIYSICVSLGYSLSFILFIIYKIRNKRKNNNANQLIIRQTNINKISWKKKMLWVLLLSIISFIDILLFSFILVKFDNYLNFWPFYIIFLSIFSFLILKNKLYKHHFISIITITILILLNNILSNNLTIDSIKENYIFYLLGIVNMIFYSLELVLYKYCMLIKYIKSYEILFFGGLIILALSIISLIIAIKIGYIDNFRNYYENIDKIEVIIFISLSLINFIYGILLLIIIDIFSPFYMLLADKVENLIYFFYTLNENDLSFTLFYIVFLIIYIFMVLVFIELIELNFLGLSKMTKRNIELRARFESLESNEYDINDTSDSILEGYIIHDENEVELNKDEITDGKTVSNE